MLKHKLKFFFSRNNPNSPENLILFGVDGCVYCSFYRGLVLGILLTALIALFWR